MPKPLVNNKITYNNIHGRIIQHDIYLNQGVRSGDSPTFANLQLTGDATIEGNLYVLGNTTVLNTNVIEFEDNIILLNKNESGSGVTLNQAGLEINRGSLENYRIVFNELDDTTRIGRISNTQAVATREDDPLDSGFMIWNETLKRLDSTNTFSLDLVVTSTTQSISSTTGCIVGYGGLGIKKDFTLDGTMYITGNTVGATSAIWTDPTTNSLSMNSQNDIYMYPMNKIQIPFNTKLVFGNTDCSISANDATKDVLISAGGNIIINVPTNKYVSVPNQIPITFSTINEKVYTDSSNNMVVQGSQDINFIPGPNKKILVPVDTKLSFSNNQQYLSSNLNNDLTIGAGNEINLIPGSGLNINVPTDNPIKFGGSGNQKVYSDSNNALFIQSSGDINISPSSGNTVNIPANINLTFANDSTYIVSNTSGEISVSGNKLTIANTTNAINSTTASTIFNGGVSVSKNIFTNGRFILETNSTEALLLSDTNLNNILRVDTLNKSISINTTSDNLLNIHNSFILDDSINTITNNYKNHFTNTTDVTGTDGASIIISGGIIVDKKTSALGNVKMYSGLDMTNTKITNLQNPLIGSDAATKEYVDLVKQGLFVKDSVRVTTTTSGSLSTDFIAGNLIDGYTLVLEDRILIKDQLDPIENGIYVVTNSTPTRPLDFNTGMLASGTFVFVQDGSVNKSLGWICNSIPGSDVIDTDPLNFTQFTGLGQVIAGDGLSKILNTIDVNVDNYSIEITSDTLRVKNTWISTGLTGGSGSPLQTITDQSHVTKLGTINTGTWQGNTVQVPWGGTGRDYFTSGNILYGNHTSGLSTITEFFFDTQNTYLGLGTGSPSNLLTLTSSRGSTVSLNSDSLNTSDTVNLIMSYGSSIGSTIGLSRDFNQFGVNVYPDSLIISSSEKIQLLTSDSSRVIITDTGLVGINTSNPNYYLDVNGTLAVNDVIRSFSTIGSTNQTSASFVLYGGASISDNLHIYSTDNSAVIVDGGIRIDGGINSSTIGNGGDLTVNGGAAITDDLYIGGTIFANNSTVNFSKINLTSTEESLNTTTGSIITEGGITIKSTTNSSSYTRGGGLSIYGGISAVKDAYIGGNIDIAGTSTLNDSIFYKGHSLLDTINNTSGNSRWIYLGKLNVSDSSNGYSEILLSGGVQLGETNTSNLKLICSIAGTSNSISHVHSGNLHFNSSKLVRSIIYNDNDILQLFLLVPPISVTNIHVVGNLETYLSVSDEGTSSSPDGSTSGYTGSWTEEYSTNKESNYSSSIGDFVVEGTSLKIADNLPIIGYNNINTTNSRNIGTVYQRYQSSNDSGSGDIVSQLGQSDVVDTLPSQLGASSTQIKFSISTNNTDSYYNDWWIKVVSGSNINQTRRIVSYNGSLHVAEIDSPWTTQNPSSGDTIEIYGSSYVSNYFNESEDRFKLVYNSLSNKQVMEHNYCDLALKKLYIYDTTPSTGLSTGSIISLGGITISNTNNATNYTLGNALTVQGGTSIAKDLYVGDNIFIGKENTSPQERLHISGTNGTVRLSKEIGGYDYIDFTTNGNGNRFGILVDTDDTFNITSTASGDTPNNSTKLITVVTNGNIGIGCTSNMNSLLTLKESSFISSVSEESFIGINGGNNSSGSTIILYGTSSGSNSGNLDLYSGTTGSFNVYTDELKQLELNNAGQINLYCTSPTKSHTSGSLFMNGGLVITCSENSVNISNGGSLFTEGGGSIRKDLFVGGDLYITGNINAGGTVAVPTITFSNTDNCSVSTYYNNNIITISNELLLTFTVEIIPDNASENCSVEFSLPSRTNGFTNRGEFIASCTSWTDDTNLFSVYNCLSTGIVGTTRALLKFQSVSTDIHYFSLICRYTSA
jgi:hypothetical protein